MKQIAAMFNHWLANILN